MTAPRGPNAFNSTIGYMCMCARRRPIGRNGRGYIEPEGPPPPHPCSSSPRSRQSPRPSRLLPNGIPTSTRHGISIGMEHTCVGVGDSRARGRADLRRSPSTCHLSVRLATARYGSVENACTQVCALDGTRLAALCASQEPRMDRGGVSCCMCPASVGPNWPRCDREAVYGR
jgi:hypothetical protein